MLAVGTLGGPAIGILQDRAFDGIMTTQNSELHSQVMVDRVGLLGAYKALDQAKVEKLPEAEKKVIHKTVAAAQQGTLGKIAVLPLIMFGCYIGLIVYFQSRGGYKAQVLTGHAAEDERFTGGLNAPMEG